MPAWVKVWNHVNACELKSSVMVQCFTGYCVINVFLSLCVQACGMKVHVCEAVVDKIVMMHMTYQSKTHTRIHTCILT
jgi:hypothetical protein